MRIQLQIEFNVQHRPTLSESPKNVEEIFVETKRPRRNDIVIFERNCVKFGKKIINTFINCFLSPVFASIFFFSTTWRPSRHLKAETKTGRSGCLFALQVFHVNYCIRYFYQSRHNNNS